MRSFVTMAALVVVLGPVAADEIGLPQVGQVVEASVNDSPGVVKAQVGDVLYLVYSYPVVPGAMPSTLKVEPAGKEVSNVAVVSVPNRAPNGAILVGAGKLAAVLKADKAGTVKVKVTPQTSDPKVTEITVTVESR